MKGITKGISDRFFFLVRRRERYDLSGRSLNRISNKCRNKSFDYAAQYNDAYQVFLTKRRESEDRNSIYQSRRSMRCLEIAKLDLCKLFSKIFFRPLFFRLLLFLCLSLRNFVPVHKIAHVPTAPFGQVLSK